MSPPAPQGAPPNSPELDQPWGDALLSIPDWKPAGSTGQWGGQVRSAASQGFGSIKVFLCILQHFWRNQAPEVCPEIPARGFSGCWC